MPNSDTAVLVLKVLELLGVLLVVAMGVALRSFIIQKAKTWATKSDIENLTRQVEAVKAEFRIAAYEHETRFSRLYDRRADAIDELYKRLVRTIEAFQPLVRGMVPREGEDAESFDKQLERARSIAFNLRQFFVEHKLYFSQGVTVTFSEVQTALNDALVTYTLDGHDLGQAPPMERQRIIEAWTTAGGLINARVPELLQGIERQMGRDIGASDAAIDAIEDVARG